MGKLNYSARKISGLKAGQAVSKDLKKRIPPGTGAKAAARDPTVEIDISGKCLTDEGFAEFIDDLIACIKYRDEEHLNGSAKVMDLHLQGNQLTVLSLPKLSEVIKSSVADLRELDISNNNFEVRTPEEQEIWYNFLDSFKNCFLLKKLDLGNNPLGPKGIEIFARVYTQSDLDYLEADADAVIGLNGEEKHQEEPIVEEMADLKISNGKENVTPKKGASKQSPKKGKVAQNGSSHASSATKKLTYAELKRYACTRGLRSVPLIILSNTNLTGSGAIHLSSMLTMHRTSEQLLAFLPVGKCAVPDTTSEQGKGIVWLPNEGLGPNECKLLDKAEMVRELKSNDDTEKDDFSDEDSHHETMRKMQKKLDTEYARLGKRVCIEAFKKEGVHNSDIWKTALKMMLVSRAILLDDKDRAIEAPPKEQEEENGDPASIEEMLDEEPAEPAEPVEPVEPAQPAEPNPEYTLDDFEDIESYLLGPFHPAAKHFEVNFPSLQPIDVPKEREFQETKDSSLPSQVPRSGKGKNHSNSVSRNFRKREWRFGLPFGFWRQIIADAVGADGILSIPQQVRIITYAADWNALSYELTIQGAEDHQQIWKFLETVKCINYSSSS